MTFHAPEAGEEPRRTLIEEMALWKASLLSVALHVLVIGGIAKGIELEPSSRDVPVQHTQGGQNRKVSEVLAEVDRANELVQEVKKARSQKIDELIDQYLDSGSEKFSGETAHVDVYLELDSYDSVEHWLKRLPSNEAVEKDWKVEAKKRKEAWQVSYQKALDRIIAEDYPWTGNVAEDFSHLQNAMYLDEGAFFSQPGQSVNYARKADTAHEQLEFSQVNCTSSRFTPWILQAIYEDRGLPTDELKNLKAIQWADHIASFLDEGSGLQLQEMDTEVPTRAGRNSPETGNSGQVGGLNMHLADYFAHEELTSQQAARLALVYLKPTGKYAVKDPPALAALKKTSTSDSRAEQRPVSASLASRSVGTALSDYEGFSNLIEGQAGGLYEAPAWMSNERTRRFVLQQMRENKLGNGNVGVSGVELDLFGNFELFYSSEAKELVRELETKRDLEYLAYKFFTSDGTYKIPSMLLRRILWDEKSCVTLSKLVAKELARPVDDQRGTWWFEKKRLILEQLKSERVLEQTLNPGKPLPDLNIPVDAEMLLAEKEFRTLQLLLAKDGVELTEKEFDFTTSTLKEAALYEKYKQDLQKLEVLLDASQTVDRVQKIIEEIQDEQLLATLKPMYIKRELKRQYPRPRETREPVASWVREVYTEKRKKGEISDLELYELGWEEVIPPGTEQLNFVEYYENHRSEILIPAFPDPSPTFINLMRQHYLNGFTAERLALLKGLCDRNLFIIPAQDLYPEDKEWISRNAEAPSLQFFYADDFKAQALNSSALEGFEFLDPRNLEWTGASWDRVADVWEEMDRRGKER